MRIQEISFREWVVCKIRNRYVAPVVPVNVSEPLQRPKKPPATLMVRQGGDRRTEAADEGFVRMERRRRPERRIPEVGEASFDEFERWKNQQAER